MAKRGPKPVEGSLALYLQTNPADACRRIINVYRQVGGITTYAARALGVERTTLWRIVHRYGLLEQVEQVRALVERVYKVKLHRRGFATAGQPRKRSKPGG